MRNKILLFIAFVVVVASVLVWYSTKPVNRVVEDEREENIRVSIPATNDEIGLPLIIRGEARVFENMLNYRLRDSDGSVLLEDMAYANSPDIGLFGSFEIEINYPEPKGDEGMLEVFDYSARDGSEIDKVIIPIRFKEVESMNVNVFFGNNEIDEGSMYCERSYPISRRIPRTAAPARAALLELLRGPTRNEYEQGYFTSINSGVEIQRLVIENDTAQVDFSDTLEFQVGGSCRVAAIRSQITEILKQFSSVQDVIISINGRTEDILQP